jgi:hypothetical protein
MPKALYAPTSTANSEFTWIAIPRPVLRTIRE